MIRNTLILLLLLTLSGCVGFGNVTSTLTLPNGEKYVVNSKPDALVEFEQKGRKVTVDNRGRPGLIEQILGAIFLRAPDMTVEAH